MSPEAQRIAIAEACGWKFEHKNKGSNYWVECIVVTSPGGKQCHGWCPNPPPYKAGKAVDEYHKRVAEDIAKTGIPDYLNDLNAMHEAEEVLIEEESPAVPILYRGYLDIATRGRPWHATAAHKAECLLKARNLWTAK